MALARWGEWLIGRKSWTCEQIVGAILLYLHVEAS